MYKYNLDNYIVINIISYLNNHEQLYINKYFYNKSIKIFKYNVNKISLFYRYNKIRLDMLFEYFDSYGNDIDEPIYWVNKETQQYLDLKPYLTNLLEKSNKNIIYNSKDFQKENRNIATCGRHCILRALTILKDGQQLTDYIKMMNSINQVTGYNYDDIVSAIISI
jgi:hypothetical protein